MIERLGEVFAFRPFGRRDVGSGYYHDLLCRSGFGDRITDLWAAVTIARLHDPDVEVTITWRENGKTFRGFVGNYSRDLFSISGCRFVPYRPWESRSFRRKERRFNDRTRIDDCLLPLRSGACQIVLRSGSEWGNNCPDRLHGELSYYELDPAIELSRIVDTYRSVARSTEPAASLKDSFPDDVSSRLGIHLRLQDKLKAEPNAERAFTMSEATWNGIEARSMEYIQTCIARGEKFFICSDDMEYRDEVVQRIKALGGDIVCADIRPEHSQISGYAALVDFFCLARCSEIIQMTKYSTYSIAAALVGDVPLVNFYQNDHGIGNRLDIWRSVLPPGPLESDCRGRADHGEVSCTPRKLYAGSR